MKRLLVSVLLGLFVSMPVFVSAHPATESEVRELSYDKWQEYFEVWKGDLRGLMESFAVVRNDGKIEYPFFDTFTIKRQSGFNGHHKMYWNFEITVVPVNFTETYNSHYPYADSFYTSYRIVLTQYAPVRFTYVDELNGSTDKVFQKAFEIPVTIVVGHSSLLDLSKDQIELLRNAVKTQTPVRMKGTLFVTPWGTTVEEVVKNWEEHEFEFFIKEVNGIPVVSVNR